MSGRTAAHRLDVNRLRSDTPGTSEVIHLNNAGASLPPQAVISAVADYADLEARVGGYEAAAERSEDLAAARSLAAALIGAQEDEIALLDSATRGWLMAIHSIPFRPGDVILTGAVEYATNFISYLQLRERHGIKVEVVPNDAFGQIDLEVLAGLLGPRVRLVALTHMPTNGGLLNPAAEVGRLTQASGALYLLDACQTVGQLPLDVTSLGCDLLTATGRKYLRAPRGTGFLYASRAALDQLDPVMLDLHGATWESPTTYQVRAGATRFETWEFNHATRVGLAAAITYARSVGLKDAFRRTQLLAERLRMDLRELGGVRVHDLGRERGGIVTFTVNGVSADEVRCLASQRRINVSVSRARSTRIDMHERGLEELVRASVHYFNDDNDLAALTELVRAIRRT